MDLTEGDNVEINAAKARYIHLHRIAVSKKCEGFDKNEPILIMPSKKVANGGKLF